MHILFVTPVVPSPSYGRRPYNFIRYLAGKHRVDLACFLTDPARDMVALRQLAGWGVRVRTVEHSACRGIWNCATGWPRLEPLRTLWVRSPALKALIRELTGRNSYDVAHFDRMRMGHFALEVPKVPRVVDFTDALMLYLKRSVTPHRSVPGRVIDAWEKWRIPAYERRLLSRLEAGICCSRVDAEVFRQYHPGFPVEVIINSVDAEHFKPRSSEEKSPRLVFTGTFSYFANLDSLFYFMEQIWPEVRRRHEGIQLDLIGAKPPERVSQLGPLPGVRVLADVPDMADHLHPEDIFICPLRVASGMRNKVLEAMASGMAAVSSSIGVEGLNVQPGEHYLEADEPGKFADCIDQVMNSADLRRRLGQHGRKFVLEQHSAEAAGKALEDVYKKAGSSKFGH